MGFAEFLAEKKKGKQSVEPPKGKWVAPQMQEAPGWLDVAGRTLGNVVEAGRKEAPGFLQGLVESLPIVRAIKRGIEGKPLEAVQALNPAQQAIDLVSGLWQKGAGIAKDPGYYGTRPLEGATDILGLLGGLRIGAGKVPSKPSPGVPPIEPPIEPPFALPKPRKGPEPIPGYNQFENAPPIEKPPAPTYQYSILDAMRAPQPLPVPAKSAGPYPSSRISPIQALPGTRSMAELAGEARSPQVFEMTPEQAQAKLAGEEVSPDISGFERVLAGRYSFPEFLQRYFEKQRPMPWQPGGPPEPGPLATIRRLSPEALDALMEYLQIREAPETR